MFFVISSLFEIDLTKSKHIYKLVGVGEYDVNYFME